MSPAARSCSTWLLLSAAVATAAPALKLRLVNDQASVLVLLSAPARQTPAFELQGRSAESAAWVRLQPLETSFCLNPCPPNGGFPDELDCARPPRTRLAVPAGSELAITWSGQLVEEVVRHHASGKARTCTQVKPAPPRSYRLSLCADAAPAETPRCAAVSFSWPPAGSPPAMPRILRWSSSAASSVR